MGCAGGEPFLVNKEFEFSFQGPGAVGHIVKDRAFLAPLLIQRSHPRHGPPRTKKCVGHEFFFHCDGTDFDGVIDVRHHAKTFRPDQKDTPFKGSSVPLLNGSEGWFLLLSPARAKQNRSTSILLLPPTEFFG
jgi:hypothetical protein